MECPVGDFFACGWQKYAHVSSLAVCVNPGSAFNCYWEMPFRKHCRITMTNMSEEPAGLYYQVNYTLTDVPEDAGYFHAQFRRTNPLPYKVDYTILEGVEGQGPLRWHLHGLGSEQQRLVGRRRDQVLYGWRPPVPDHLRHRHRRLLLRFLRLRCERENPVRSFETLEYQEFNTPYAGLAQVIRGDGHYQVQQRFGLYRWHIMDPIRFESVLRALTIQAFLGLAFWRSLSCLQDDISSVAYWYQAEPHAPFPPLPDKDSLEII